MILGIPFLILIVIALLLWPRKDSKPTSNPFPSVPFITPVVATATALSPRQVQVNEDLEVFGEAYRESELTRHREEVLQRVASMAQTVASVAAPAGKK